MDKITVLRIGEMKREKQKIVALTSYDFSTTRLLNDAGIDIILVGDSLGMVKLGLESTLPVTVEDMVYHTRIVARANTKALVVGDMPYMSYQASVSDAVRHAGALLKAGAQAVKIEGGSEMVETIRALVRAKIPVMGHLGMMPQSVHLYGGYKVQGRVASQGKKILKDARKLEKAGVFAIVLECIPRRVADKVSRALKVPTIGIGAGVGCDGQILVVDDLLGLTGPTAPRFVKRYADLRGTIRRAAREYAREVRSKRFPDDAHSYS